MYKLSLIKKIELRKTTIFEILKHIVFVKNILKTENNVKSIEKFFYPDILLKLCTSRIALFNVI